MENYPVEMTLQISSAPITDQGKKRPNNEDWVAGFEPSDQDDINQSGFLYIVADGVGGASRGERASKYAAQKVLYEYYKYPDDPPAERLKAIIRKTGNDIYQYSIENGTARMATTMVAAVIRGNRLTVANVGDSRGYLIRGGQVTQITRDHNLANELIRSGSLTVEEAKYSKTRNKLMRSLGGEMEPDVDIFKDIPLFPGDLILLCTDGLSRYALDEDLLRLSSEGTPEEICHKMVNFANESGGADNISLYIIEIHAPGETKSNSYGGQIPIPVDWDTIQTQSGAGMISSRKPKINVFNHQIIVYSLIGVVIIMIITGVFIILNPKEQQNSPIPSLTTEPRIIGVNAYPVDTSTFLPELPELIDTTPTLSEITFTPEIIPTEATLTSGFGTNYFCIHEIQTGENITSVFSSFNPPRVFFPPAEQFLKCNKSELICFGQKINIPAPYIVYPGDYLIIPEVTEEICNSILDNYWVTTSNQ